MNAILDYTGGEASTVAASGRAPRLAARQPSDWEWTPGHVRASRVDLDAAGFVKQGTFSEVSALGASAHDVTRAKARAGGLTTCCGGCNEGLGCVSDTLPWPRGLAVGSLALGTSATEQYQARVASPTTLGSGPSSDGLRFPAGSGGNKSIEVGSVSLCELRLDMYYWINKQWAKAHGCTNAQVAAIEGQIVAD